MSSPKVHSILIILFAMVFASCSEEEKFAIQEIQNPFPSESMFPNLFSTGDEIVISYIHTIGDSIDQLFYSSFNGESFEEPIKISEGKDWFVNWADIPVIAKSGSNVLASWLDKSADGTYDYDVKMSLSNDDGRTWNEAFIPHKDGIAAEHGFVSVDVNKDGDFHSVWLDGRNTKVVDENGKEVHGQMTFRSAIIHPDGKLSNENEIDERVCDCCQTSIVSNENLTMAVYRDRSEDEIRDNYFSLFSDGEWSSPVPINNDGWKIGGCPVNGPVLASQDENIVASWYTEANGKPELYMASFNSENNAFSTPTLVSDYGVLGRTDVEYLDNGDIAIIWLEDEVDNKAIIKGKIYDPQFKLKSEINLGSTSAARSSGFPKVMNYRGKLLLVYTDVEKGKLVTKIVG